MSRHDIDPIDALRAELSRVEVSPEFAERVRRQIGEDVIESIGVELSELSVSPEFAVRVRQQIEAAPARSRWFRVFDWRWAVPVAAAAAIVAFALTRATAPTTGGADPAVVQARGPEPHIPQAPQVPQAPSVTSGPPSASVSEPPQTAAARATDRTTTSAAASVQQADDKLEVITNQPAILRQLWASVTRVEVAETPLETRELVIVPVEVTPVAVQWLVEPLPSGGVTPIIRRVSADAERSDK